MSYPESALDVSALLKEAYPKAEKSEAKKKKKRFSKIANLFSPR